ncbi:MAG: GTPase HflX [Deltaproteobacteria bacterium]|nr:GTPase HflX [Deltaproteobacteria bacterium]
MHSQSRSLPVRVAFASTARSRDLRSAPLTIHGNTTGLAPSDVHALERLYRRRVPFDRLLTPELARSMAEVSSTTGRQVGVLVDRNGAVQWVVVGDARKLMLPDIGRARAAEGRFRGLRLIHTHLTQEGLTRDDLVDLTRLRLDLVCAICLGTDGQPITVHYGHNVAVADGRRDAPYLTFGPIPYGREDSVDPSTLVTELEESFASIARTRKVDGKDGRAILVHVTDKKQNLQQAEDSLRELEELARTAGVAVVDRVLQVRDAIDAKFVLGRGKLDEIVLKSMALDATVLVFDRNLSPSQASSIAGVTELKVIDRTQLILDIFAQRAESRDGKLQVELAQMKYLLPRIGQKDDALSRLTGGIGGRGPGETVLEIGKRRARDRVTRLEHELEHLAVQRKQRRQRRGRRDVPIVSIVGYTNAGKSTLLNTLTGSETLAENKLFATLDTRSRRIRFPREREVVITDTVGFIRDLPKELFAAFRATFEETEDADLLLHVVDVSDPAIGDHIRATEHLLNELGLGTKPTLLVLNKADRLEPGDAEQIARGRGGIAVSAMDRESLRPLLVEMESRLFPDGKTRLVDDPKSSYVGELAPLGDTDGELLDDEVVVGAAE